MNDRDQQTVDALVARINRGETRQQMEKRRAACIMCTGTGDCTYHAFFGMYTQPSHIIRAVNARLGHDDTTEPPGGDKESER